MSNSQLGRTLQEFKTSMAPAAVLDAAKKFFGPKSAVYAAFIERESPHHIVMRGQGGEEIIIATHADGDVTTVSGSSYLFDAQVARFLFVPSSGERSGGRVSESSFVSTLRAHAGTVGSAPAGAGALTIRAQLAEAWDAVRIVVAPTETVANVKARAVEALAQSASFPDQFLVTLRGAAILDESASLHAAGVINGSTLLVEYRHRRPVR